MDSNKFKDTLIAQLSFLLDKSRREADSYAELVRDIRLLNSISSVHFEIDKRMREISQTFRKLDASKRLDSES